MKTRNFLLAIFIGALTTINVTAQSYNNAVGLRLGSSSGITFKHFVNQTDAVELIASSRWRGVQLTGLYERHKVIDNINAFKFYYGAGAHVGAWDTYRRNPWFDEYRRNYVVAGIDGILGLEYAFKEAPISLSLDWKPEFNIIGYNGVWAGDGGLSVRYYW